MLSSNLGFFRSTTPGVEGKNLPIHKKKKKKNKKKKKKSVGRKN